MPPKTASIAIIFATSKSDIKKFFSVRNIIDTGQLKTQPSTIILKKHFPMGQNGSKSTKIPKNKDLGFLARM